MDHNSEVLRLLRRVDAQKNYLVNLERDPLTRSEPVACKHDCSMAYMKEFEDLKRNFVDACTAIVKKQLAEDEKKLEAINVLLSDNPDV